MIQLNNSQLKINLEKILFKFGEKTQILKFLEETSELNLELIKKLNNLKFNEENLKEEIIDVQLTLFQLLIIFNIDEDYFNLITEKKLSKLCL